jgi:hypothetical protein
VLEAFGDVSQRLSKTLAFLDECSLPKRVVIYEDIQILL